MDIIATTEVHQVLRILVWTNIVLTFKTVIEVAWMWGNWPVDKKNQGGG